MREREHQSWRFQRRPSAAVLAWGAVVPPGSVESAGSGPRIGSLSPEAGPAGTQVVVRSVNFGASIGARPGTSGVSFSGTSATPSLWSETEIRVAFPAGPVTGPVVVTVGGVASDGVEFTVTGAGTSGPLLIPGEGTP